MAKVRFSSHSRTHGIAVGVLLVLVGLIGDWAVGQTTELPSTRPLLDQLNRETQSLFKEVAPSIVRVQLPLPTNLMLPPDDPLSKWAGRLDQESLRRLAELQRDSPGTSFATAEIRPAAVPASSQAAP